MSPEAGPPPKMKRKEYEREMRLLHGELVAMQEWVKASGARICIVFEGRDTAGKGGTIKRITERVSPRDADASRTRLPGGQCDRCSEDAPRARNALRRAERAAETLTGAGTSVWSFPAGRQAIFSLSIAVHTGDPAAALRAAAAAEACWSAGDPKVIPTWAQVRAGAAMAYLMMDSLDGAAAQISPVLELVRELRINTVTGYLESLGSMLGQPRYADSGLAVTARNRCGTGTQSGPRACWAHVTAPRHGP